MNVKKYLVKGEMLSVTEAAKKYGLSIYAVRQRMYDKGMTLEEAIFYNPAKKTVNKGSKEWQKMKGKPRLKPEDI